MRLLTAAGNGNGTAVPIRGWGNRELSHLYTLFVWGEFGGGTVTLEISPDGTNWFEVSDVALTAAGCINVEFRAPHVRAVVSGGTDSAVDAFIG